MFDVLGRKWREVFLLSDGYVGNGSEPWMIPDVSNLQKIQAPFVQGDAGEESFKPFHQTDYLLDYQSQTQNEKSNIEYIRHTQCKKRL